MATQKALRFIYQAKASKTGLTDVKAQVFLNGVAKATGTNAIVATELGYGIYEVVLSAANLTSWGVSAGNLNALEVVIDSATWSLPAPYHVDTTVANLDDVDSHLTAQDTAIAAIKSDTAAVKVDLETGTSSLANILSAVNQIQANAGFSVPVPATMLKPATGSNSYRIPVTLYNEKNALVDADSNSITVALVNQSGADRSQYLTGYVAGTGGANGTAPAVRDSAGQYHIDLAIPSTATQEELLFTFSYAVGGAATARKSVSEIITDVQADGFALQATQLDIQTRVTDVQSKVNDGTIGLAAANTLQAAIKTQTDKIGDSSIGLSAIKSALVGLQSDVTTNVEGAGFVTGSDSLHAISQYLQANLVSGGRAV